MKGELASERARERGDDLSEAKVNCCANYGQRQQTGQASRLAPGTQSNDGPRPTIGGAIHFSTCFWPTRARCHWLGCVCLCLDKRDKEDKCCCCCCCLSRNTRSSISSERAGGRATGELGRLAAGALYLRICLVCVRQANGHQHTHTLAPSPRPRTGAHQTHSHTHAHQTNRLPLRLADQMVARRRQIAAQCKT